MSSQYADLQGKTFIVTGATGGIGQAVSQKLREAGAHLCLLARDEARLLFLRDKLISINVTGSKPHSNAPSIEVHALDLSDTSKLQAWFKDFYSRRRVLDGLVNAAGVMPVAPLMMSRLEHIAQTLDVNLLSSLLLTQAAMRLMVRQKRGVILHFSSVVASQGAAGQSIYAASKAGLEGFCKSVAKELAPLNIRVLCIAPGMVDTPMLEALQPEQKTQAESQIAVGRLANVNEIADLCLFACSEKASYLTGQVLHIDGAMQL